MEAIFWILSAITVLGALFAITLRNLIHCVLSLILFFLGIAGHYFLLRADFSVLCKSSSISVPLPC